MAKKKTPTGDYEVGYRKPPVGTRFQKGQSGHPGGRKKGSRAFKTMLQEVMELEVELTDRGKQRRVAMCMALLLRAAQDGLAGDHKARADLFDRFERHSEQFEEAAELPEDDQAMLEGALDRLRRDKGGGDV
jgi:hypothetical protein